MALRSSLLIIVFFLFGQNLIAQTRGQELAKLWLANRFTDCTDIDAAARRVVGKNQLTLGSVLLSDCKEADLTSACLNKLNKVLKPFVEENDYAFSKTFGCKDNGQTGEVNVVKPGEKIYPANIACTSMGSGEFKYMIFQGAEVCSSNFKCSSNIKKFMFGNTSVDSGSYTLRCKKTKDPNYPCMNLNLNNCEEHSFTKLLPFIDKAWSVNEGTAVQPSTKAAQ